MKEYQSWRFWENPRNLSKKCNPAKKEIQRLQRKLSNPINERSGKPLLESTIKSYISNLKYKKNELECLEATLAELEKNDIWGYSDVDMPGLGEHVRAGGKEPYKEMLKEAMETIKTESKTRETFFRAGDLVKMVRYVFDSKYTREWFDLQDAILAAFIGTIKGITGEKEEDDVDHYHETKTHLKNI